MIDGFLIIILVMFGCIGLGVLLGWTFWGSDMKYYKNLYEKSKKYDKFTADEMEKLAEEAVNNPKFMEQFEKEMKDDTDFGLKVSKGYFDSHIKPLNIDK